MNNCYRVNLKLTRETIMRSLLTDNKHKTNKQKGVKEDD